MNHRQCLIVSLVLFFSLNIQASWQTEPYLGYGQLSAELGNKSLIDGEGMSYILGVRTGVKYSSFFWGIDYTRSGPFKVLFKSPVYGTSITSGLFTSFNGGVGVNYSFGSWSIWLGQYPYHVLEEHRIDFQMKGVMTRVGLGFSIDQKTNVYFQYENSSVKINNPNTTTSAILCYGTPLDCSLVGKTTLISIIISASI